tara:strand:+ start:288 stop:497 length:210 start_codon:yes stop_codon:yes gene_type:complete
MKKRIHTTIRTELTERQIVEISQCNFSNVSNSLDIVNWHLEQMANNGFDYQYFNIIRQNLTKGIELTKK